MVMLGSMGYNLYPPVNQQSNGICPSSIGHTSSKGPCSFAMLVDRRVPVNWIYWGDNPLTNH